jgi:hypothetical protein
VFKPALRENPQRYDRAPFETCVSFYAHILPRDRFVALLPGNRPDMFNGNFTKANG